MAEIKRLLEEQKNEFDGYDVTEDGVCINTETGHIKKPFISRGYKKVKLWKNGKSKNMLIHRMVALKYIPNPDNKPQVNHIDGNKLNNNVSNLEWCTREENMQHAYKHNLVHSKTTKVNQYDKQGNFIKQWNSIDDACKTLKLNHANICTTCKGNTNRKLVGGYLWKYVEE